jgi:hypothetical protein
MFGRPLQAAIEELARCEPTAASPIMAAIKVLAEELHGGGAGGPRLIVVSDCLERTSEFSLYRDPQDFQAFTLSDRSADRQADLRGIEFDVWLLTRARDEAYQGAALRRFWDAYLHAGGARSVHLSLL